MSVSGKSSTKAKAIIETANRLSWAVVLVAGFQGFHAAGQDPVKFSVAIDRQD